VHWAQFVEQVTDGMTLVMHGRSGGVWASSVVEVATPQQAERECAYWWRRWDSVSAVLLDGGVRVASWGSST
jgi:hypothetical protein